MPKTKTKDKNTQPLLTDEAQQEPAGAPETASEPKAQKDTGNGKQAAKPAQKGSKGKGKTALVVVDRRRGWMRSEDETRYLSISETLEIAKQHIYSLVSSKEAAEQLAQLCLVEVRRNPDLANCTPMSIAGVLVQSAKFRLPFGVRGQCFIIPRKNKKNKVRNPDTGQKESAVEAEFQIGYQGLLELARRSGQIKKIDAHVVWQKDEFEYCYGMEPTIRHSPYRGPDRGELEACYAIVWFKNGEKQFHVMEHHDVMRIKVKRAAQEGFLWQSVKTGGWEDRAWRKSVLIQLCNLLPASIDDHSLDTLADAVALDELANAGQPQQLESVFAQAVGTELVPLDSGGASLSDFMDGQE